MDPIVVFRLLALDSVQLTKYNGKVELPLKWSAKADIIRYFTTN